KLTKFRILSMKAQAVLWQVQVSGDSFNNEDDLFPQPSKVDRIKRDVGDVTTVLLVDNTGRHRDGRFNKKAVGLLTSTARTFVQGGTTTEFATQVVGTTLDNGRLYAQVVTTSSRVFYQGDSGGHNSVINVEPFSYAKYIGEPPKINEEPDSIPTIKQESSDETGDEDSRDEEKGSEESENLVKSKRMDYFKKKNTEDDDTHESETNDVKPARVRPLNDLPTYTIRHDFAPSGFSLDDNYEDSTESRNLETSSRGNRFRAGKSFFKNRVEHRKLDTVTYLGFSDFTTTVGDTVIVFMPHTSAAADSHQGRKVTSISGDPTLAPELQHSSTDREFSVATSVKTFLSHTPGMVTRTITVNPVTEQQTPTDFDDVAQYLANEQQDMAEKIPKPSSVSYNDNIESSMEEAVEPSHVDSSTENIAQQSTDSLGENEQPLGLIRVVGGTEALNGTTTLFTSLVYGTNIDGNYAQVIHSTSSVFFYVGDTKVEIKDVPKYIEPTAVLDRPNDPSTTTPSPPITTIHDEEQTEETTPPPTTLSQPADTTNKLPETTTESNSITTLQQSTIEDDKRTTNLDETLTTVPMEETTTEADTDSFNEVETGRKISSKPNDQVIIETDDNKKAKETQNLLTQLIPSTVYKTFTYFTTFFIPAEGSSTTTSIRSREVTSSEISYVTNVYDPNVQTHIESSVAVAKLPEEKTTLTTEEIRITTTTPKITIEGEKDEIELIFKTLYTTYTYLTTFFQESTTSVSSREEVITNVVTSTVDRSYILHASDPAVAGLFTQNDASSQQPVPTSVGIGRPTTKYFPDLGTNPDEDLFSSVIESVDIEKELATPTPSLDKSRISTENSNELKTFYTTYTYFTTILVDGETEVESRTEIYTNIVTP
ncbi:hypothetical protein L9F63_010476, partial [Diploptera punctata]